MHGIMRQMYPPNSKRGLFFYWLEWHEIKATDSRICSFTLILVTIGHLHIIVFAVPQDKNGLSTGSDLHIHLGRYMAFWAQWEQSCSMVYLMLRSPHQCWRQGRNKARAVKKTKLCWSILHHATHRLL